MKTPGVSLIAVARPIPTPAHARPRASPNSRSPATRVSSSVLTWPKVIVSRTGSKAIARQTATAKANQTVQPLRLISGPANHQVSSTVVSTVAVTARTTTAPNGSTDIGDMTRPANGG